MDSPYKVSMASLDRKPAEVAQETGPEEPGGDIPEPLPAVPKAGEGPFDPALRINANGL